ncbi:hypothetical protein J3L18_03105 [Mucilaginibacter gossypii]|uniref:hypothetical protein n=1 Tax=Mucilaginibacter gossypii TaxID=551996 RepID=UPI000DCEFB5D|nr:MULTISPECIES: hypothetical protein [Mucilaginibacter]QTE38076.1 hypothetical protein J3L18_03105 [Mucilaginibacter gossypii]RAV58605.1 hypothetical protein DIU36_09005 [Mucilaginibacter rubeus]
MKSEEDLDNIFKKGLEDPANHRAFNEDDWNALEQMLDKGKKRRGIVYWLPIASGIAAMLLLFLGWWFFKPNVKDDNTAGLQQVKVKPAAPKTNPVTNGVAVQHPQVTDSIKTTSPTNNNVAANSNKDNYVKAGQTVLIPSVAGANRAVTGSNKKGIVGRDTIMSRPSELIANTDPSINPLNNKASIERLLENRALSLDIQPAPLAVPDFKTNIERQPVAASVSKPDKKITKQSFGYRPQWAITALASSDVNGTNSFQGKVGSNYGLLLSFGATKKLTITSGVVYSSKPYNTSFANYHTAYTFKHDPTDVTADCKMLDIPVNIAYQVYGNIRNKLSVGTGLSSYLMLHEKYTYNYADGANSAAWPQNYTVPNSKGYLLSIININATYEHKINSKVGVSVQPYMKVPISGVGYSDIKLQSTGVAVGVTYNLNSFSKP